METKILNFYFTFLYALVQASYWDLDDFHKFGVFHYLLFQIVNERT